MKRLLILVALATLSACASGGEQQPSLNSSIYSAEEKSSSATTEAYSTSEPLSSESSLESSSDDKVYHLVSIYQSYPERPDAAGRTGVRFDSAFNIEDGKPLYTTTEEMNAFTAQFKPAFTPYGGAYSLIPLFYDVECTIFYVHGTPITSDSTFYYYMAG